MKDGRDDLSTPVVTHADRVRFTVMLYQIDTVSCVRMQLRCRIVR